VGWVRVDGGELVAKVRGKAVAAVWLFASDFPGFAMVSKVVDLWPDLSRGVGAEGGRRSRWEGCCRRYRCGRLLHITRRSGRLGEGMF